MSRAGPTRAATARRVDPLTRAAATEAMRMHDVEPEYIALVDPNTFSPVDTVNGRVLVAVAARIGDTRLIDNVLLTTEGAPQ